MRSVLAFLVALIAVTGPVQAMQVPGSWSPSDQIIDAQLVADRDVVAPGEDFLIGLHQVMPDGWHTYWRNPGDNGLPVEIDWTVPDGVTVGDILWPTPVELPLSDIIMDYGYRGEVVLPMPVTVDAGYAGTRIDIRADAVWLVCEEICVPEERTLSLSLPVGPEPVQSEAGYWYIRGALDALPTPRDDIDASFSLSDGYLVLALAGGPFTGGETEIRDLKLFPAESGLIEHARPQTIEQRPDETLVIAHPGYQLENGLDGDYLAVLTYDVQVGDSWQSQSIEITVPAADREFGLASEAAADPAVSINLLVMFIAALAGGLILNLMPCVFPILSIKVLKFVQSAHGHPEVVRIQGLVFLAGVLVSFVGLAGLLVILREIGMPVGWGFQLQVPLVVAILSLLLFAIGLNLMGAFEVGSRLMGVGAGLADKPGKRGAFFTGVLAVVVAAPCVGPLAAGALGLALTQPAPVVLLIAAALGLGLAAPFVLLSFFPALLERLPRPGPWMVTFRQVLAFPMFGSALWLMWVLAIQTGANGVLLLGIAMLALAFAVWAHGQRGLVWRLMTVLGLVLIVVSTAFVARLPDTSATIAASSTTEPWSRERVSALRSEGRAVFVDVTAAWCVTCQVNKMRVLNDADVRTAFAEFDVAFLQADWTNRNEDIAALISEHDQAGVPLYLLYPADGGPARVLPTVLSRDGVISALQGAVGR
ncbi:protein-disulfide reductase DsbD family protein [Maricaulis sp. CAU 1757]